MIHQSTAEQPTILVVNGYTVYAPDWEQVMWGSGRGVPGEQHLGRIATSFLLYLRGGIDFFVWNGGSSAKEGLSESRYIHKFAREKIHDLKQDFPDYFSDFTDEDISALAYDLDSRSLFEERSVDTFSSIQALPRLLREENLHPQAIILVSSANHVQRVLRDAINVFSDAGMREVVLSGVSSQTSYGGGDAARVQIQDLGGAYIDRTALGSIAASVANSEREAIWSRYNAMLLANTVVTGVLVNTSSLAMKFALIFFGFCICYIWWNVTHEGWKYYRLCEDVSKELWPKEYARCNVYDTKTFAREYGIAKSRLPKFGEIKGAFRGESAIKTSTFLLIKAFFLMYIVLFVSLVFSQWTVIQEMFFEYLSFGEVLRRFLMLFFP